MVCNFKNLDQLYVSNGIVVSEKNDLKLVIVLSPFENSLDTVDALLVTTLVSDQF